MLRVIIQRPIAVSMLFLALMLIASVLAGLSVPVRPAPSANCERLATSFVK